MSENGIHPARKFPESPPAYRVIPIVKTPRIDPGDSFELDIYFSGYGKVERQKLLVLFPHPEILNDEQPGVMRIGIVGHVDWNNNAVRAIITGDKITELDTIERERPVDQVGITINLPGAFFADDLREMNLNEIDIGKYPQLYSEQLFDESPPVRVKLNTKSDSESGDYTIPVTFTFGADGYIYQSSEDVTLHINNKREQLEPWVTRAGIATVLVALMSLVHQAGFFNWIPNLIP